MSSTEYLEYDMQNVYVPFQVESGNAQMQSPVPYDCYLMRTKRKVLKSTALSLKLSVRSYKRRALLKRSLIKPLPKTVMHQPGAKNNFLPQN